jgi:hypothetical protein
VKLALHRSITFWSGLLVMGFIVWAWCDSAGRYSYAYCKYWKFDNGYCGAAISYSPTRRFDTQAGVLPLLVHRAEVLPLPLFIRGGGEILAQDPPGADDPDTTRREWIRSYMRVEGPETWTWFIPHWFLLLTFALLWTALLLWRARRRKRAAGLL